MISYETYKLLHLYSLFGFLASSAVMLLQPLNKIYKMLSGIFSLLALTGGMGLMARLGGGFQAWIVMKLVILLLLTGFVHAIAKRRPDMGTKAVWVMVVCFCVAATLAIYKPV